MYSNQILELVPHFLQTTIGNHLQKWHLGTCITTCLHGLLAFFLTARTQFIILQGWGKCFDKLIMFSKVSTFNIEAANLWMLKRKIIIFCKSHKQVLNVERESSESSFQAVIWSYTVYTILLGTNSTLEFIQWCLALFTMYIDWCANCTNEDAPCSYSWRILLAGLQWRNCHV